MPDVLAAEVPKKTFVTGVRGRRYFKLNAACRLINKFMPGDGHTYLVGSTLRTDDFHDVDVRYMMADADWERVFNGADPRDPRLNGIWSLLCFTVSEWLSNETGLDVDFQIQQQTRANEDFPGPRSALGHTEFYPGGG